MNTTPSPEGAAPYAITPEGVTRYPLDQAGRLLEHHHGQHAEEWGCPPGHPWHECDTFAVARIRGLTETVYAVAAPDQAGKAGVVVWIAEGPAGACGALCYPVEQLGDAVLHAVQLALLEPAELAELVTGAAAARMATALDQLQASRWTP